MQPTTATLPRTIRAFVRRRARVAMKKSPIRDSKDRDTEERDQPALLEELVQEGMIGAFIARKIYRPGPKPFLAFCRRWVDSYITAELLREVHLESTPVQRHDTPSGAHPWLAEESARSEVESRIHRMLNRLPLLERIILRERLLNPDPPSLLSLASALRISPSLAHRSEQRALARLQAWYIQ